MTLEASAGCRLVLSCRRRKRQDSERNQAIVRVSPQYDPSAFTYAALCWLLRASAQRCECIVARMREVASTGIVGIVGHGGPAFRLSGSVGEETLPLVLLIRYTLPRYRVYLPVLFLSPLTIATGVQVRAWTPVVRKIRAMNA